MMSPVRLRTRDLATEESHIVKNLAKTWRGIAVVAINMTLAAGTRYCFFWNVLQ